MKTFVSQSNPAPRASLAVGSAPGNLSQPPPAAGRALATAESLPADPDPGWSWQARRDCFREALRQHPLPGLGVDELDVHFASMPDHYWERLTGAELVWGLNSVHGFLGLMASPHTPATTPFVGWQQAREPAGTRVMLCTWDRHGLLAKAAAAFSAVRLNILEADAYTRSDNVVLDVFAVAELDGRRHVASDRLEEMTVLLGGALSEPPRFTSVWACSRHKFLAPAVAVPLRIAFDNESVADRTLVHVEAADRLGLLYDVLQALSDSSLEVVQARVQTDGSVARDTLHVTDAQRRPIVDPGRLAEIRANLEAALTVAG